MRRGVFASFALLAALGGIRVASAEPARLGIEDVARLAIASEPELKAARERTQASVHRTDSARGRLLPSLHVSDEYQHWDSPFTIPFGAEVLTARNADTNTFAVGARQPLLGLLHGTQDYSAARSSADAAAAGVAVDESATREGVELEYLRLFAAKARSDIARSSEEELGQQVSETAVRVKAGTLTNSDLLRVQVAQANARQQGIVADAEATVSRANLLSAIGRSPDDTATEFVPPTALLAQNDIPVPVANDAVARRPEMKEARLRAESADHVQSSATYSLLPEVDLEAGYARVDGQVFAPKNSAFVGVKADWAIWEWGANWGQKQAAAAESRAAVQEIESTRRRVVVEITARKAELVSAASAVALAQQTIVSAQEAYRVTEVQVRAGAGTTTDLLAAQSALTQARLQLENARYAQAMVRIRLERAMGTR